MKRRARGRGQRRLHPRRGAPLRRPGRDGRRRATASSRTRSGSSSPASSSRAAGSSAWTTTPTASRAASSPPARSPTRAGRSAPASARIEVDDKIVAKNVGPQGEGGARSSTRPTSTTRSARTAAPRASSSRTSATRPTAASTSGTAFFWAMGRSLDQTFYADYYSKVGYGFGHELRYAARLAVAGRLPHVPLPVPGHAHDPRPRHRRGRAGRHRRQHRLRHRLERAADAARQRCAPP